MLINKIFWFCNFCDSTWCLVILPIFLFLAENTVLFQYCNYKNISKDLEKVDLGVNVGISYAHQNIKISLMALHNLRRSIIPSD